MGGLKRLRTEPYSPADFSVETFDRRREIWPDALKQAAEKASPAERRNGLLRMGSWPIPTSRNCGALGVVEDGKGGWAMNCLTCHQGKVAGKVVRGAPNSHFAFTTLTQDVIKGRKAAGEKISPAESASPFPLGLSNGTTNAQTFSIVLSALRDKDLNVVKSPKIPRFKNNDLDAPPYWNVKRKKNLYIDGFVPKTHRVIMQFALLPTNSPESFKEREEGFRDILAWIDSLDAPKYPFEVERCWPPRGAWRLRRALADCHGTYGPGGKYPEKRVPLDVVGTDAVRLEGMPAAHRRFYRDSWFGEYGKLEVVEEPDGYVAPPLDGVWASGPYFHNGSVPTLWHVLHPERRPAAWLRTEDGYDQKRRRPGSGRVRKAAGRRETGGRQAPLL